MAEFGDARLPQRFWDKVRVAESGCWMWTGALNTLGYAAAWDGERVVLGHRWAYERLIGPIAEYLVSDHLCCTPACVNPSHIDPVSQGENVRRGRQAVFVRGDPFCRKGHPISEPGSVHTDSRGNKSCLVCLRESWRRNSRVKRERRRNAARA